LFNDEGFFESGDTDKSAEERKGEKEKRGPEAKSIVL